MAEMLANLQVGFDLNSDKFVSKTKVVKNELNSLSNQSVSPMQMKLQGLSGRFGKLAQTMSSLGPAFSGPATVLSQMSNVTKVLGNNFNKISPIISRVSNVFKQVSFGSISTMVKSLGSSVLSLGGAFSRLGASIKASGLVSLSGIFSSLKSGVGHLATLPMFHMGRIQSTQQIGSQIAAGTITSSIVSGTLISRIIERMTRQTLPKYINPSSFKNLSPFKQPSNVDTGSLIPIFTPSKNPFNRMFNSTMGFIKNLRNSFKTLFTGGLLLGIGKFDLLLKGLIITATSLSVVIAGIALSPLLLFGFTKLAKMIAGMMENLDQLGEKAEKLGVPSEALKLWQEMGTFAGYNAETLERSLRNMMRSINSAKFGANKKQNALDMLGLNSDELMKSEHQLIMFEKIMRNLSKIKDKNRRLAVTQELFGVQNATELANVPDNVDKYMERVKKNINLGNYKDLDRIGEYFDKIDDLNQRSQSMKDRMKRDILLPVGEGILDVIDGINWILDPIIKQYDKLKKKFSLWNLYKPNKPKTEDKKDSELDLSLDEEFLSNNDQLLAKLKTPLDTYKEQLLAIDMALRGANINEEQYIKLKDMLLQEFVNINNPMKDYADGIELHNQALKEGVITMDQFIQKKNELLNDLKTKLPEVKLAEDITEKQMTPLENMMKKLKELYKARNPIKVSTGESIGGLSDSVFELENKSIMKELVDSLDKDGNKIKNIIDFISSTLWDFQRETIDGLDFSKFKEILTEDLIKEFPAINPLDDIQKQIDAFTYLLWRGVLPVDNYNAAITKLLEEFTPSKNNLDEFAAKLQGIRREFEMGAISASQFGRETMDTINGYQISDPTEMYNAMSMLANQRTGMPENQFDAGITDIFDSLENNEVNAMGKIDTVFKLLNEGILKEYDAASLLQNVFYDIEAQAIELERALMMGNITPETYMSKFGPLLDIFKKIQEYGYFFTPSADFFKFQEEKFQNWQNMMSQSMEAMNAMAEQYPAPWGMGPGIHTKINPGEGGGGGPEQEGSPGMYTASQIKGVLTSAKYRQEDYERETATNTKTLVELFTRITYGHGGIYSLG